MKKLILVIASIALLAACSKKHDAKPLTPQTATAKDLAGTSVLAVDTNYTTVNGKSDTSIITNNQGIKFQFNADGTGAEILVTFVVDFTYTVSNGTIHLHTKATASESANDVYLTITLITATKLVTHEDTSDGVQVLSFVKN